MSFQDFDVILGRIKLTFQDIRYFLSCLYKMHNMLSGFHQLILNYFGASFAHFPVPLTEIAILWFLLLFEQEVFPSCSRSTSLVLRTYFGTSAAGGDHGVSPWEIIIVCALLINVNLHCLMDGVNQMVIANRWNRFLGFNVGWFMVRTILRWAVLYTVTMRQVCRPIRYSSNVLITITLWQNITMLSKFSWTC